MFSIQKKIIRKKFEYVCINIHFMAFAIILLWDQNSFCTAYNRPTAFSNNTLVCKFVYVCIYVNKSDFTFHCNCMLLMARGQAVESEKINIPHTFNSHFLTHLSHFCIPQLFHRTYIDCGSSYAITHMYNM